MQTILAINTIVSDENVRNGQPVIAGTTIRVIDVAASHIFRGLNAEEIAVNFGLDMGEAHAALAYYYQHSDEIDTLIRDEMTRADQLLAILTSQNRLIRVE